MAIPINEFIKQSGGTTKDIQILDKNNFISKSTQSNQKEDMFGAGIVGGKMKTGQEFIAQPLIKQYAQAFIQTLPKSIYDFAIKTPMDFAKSVAEAIPTLATGGKYTPDLGGYVSESKKALEGGAKPFGWEAMAKPELKTLGAGLATLGELKAIGTVAKELTPVATKSVSNIAGWAGRALKETGKSTYGITITPKEQTAKALTNYQAKFPNLYQRVKAMITGKEIAGKPITEAETAARYGIVGTEKELGVQSKRISDSLWNDIIEPNLKAQKKVVNMPTFISELEKEINATPELGRRADLIGALKAFKEEYRNVGKIGLEKLQQYKAGWAEFIPEKTYIGKPIGGAYKEIQNLAADKARGIIYNLVGDTGKQAYIDYGNLKSIYEAGTKSTTKDIAKSSGFRVFWRLLMDKALTPIATFSGKILYKTGEGLEFIGNEGAKKVGDIIK